MIKQICHFIIIFLISVNCFAVIKGIPVTNLDILNSTVKITGEGGTCTGIVVGKRTILTAAHCIDAEGNVGTPLLKPIFVQKFDSANLTGDMVGVLFSFSTLTAEAGKDIGYIYLSSDLELPIAPIKIATSFSMSDELCIVGQGKDEDGNSGTLKFVCGLKPQLDTHFGLFFIGSTSDSLAGVGSGDSGGPVYKKLPDGSFQIVGIVSRGSSVVEPGKNPLYSEGTTTINLMTDITTGFAASWISTYKCMTYNFVKTDQELCDQ